MTQFFWLIRNLVNTLGIIYVAVFLELGHCTINESHKNIFSIESNQIN